MSDATPTPSENAVHATLGYHTSAGGIPEGWTNATAHGIRPELADQEWRRALYLLLGITLPVSLIGIGVGLWFFRDNAQGLLMFSILMPAVLIGLITVRVFRTRRQFDARWPSFRVVVGDQGLLRTRRDLPDLTILVEDIRELRELRAGVLVRGTRNVDLILIPRSLEGYDQIRQRLSAIRPIIAGGGQRLMAQVIAVNLILVGGFFTGLITSNPAIRWSLTALLWPIAIWALVQNLRSPNLSPSQKLAAPVILLFPIVLLLESLLPFIRRMWFP